MKGDFIVQPEHFLRYLRKNLHLRPSQTRLPKWGVIVFGEADWQAVRRTLQGKRLSWDRWLAMGRTHGVRAAVARSQIGAPSAAIVMEEMAALGVRNFLAFGACGSLVERLPIGSVVIPTFAHPDEGTSRHYGNPRKPRPDPQLLRAVVAACKRRAIPFAQGGTWTVDAPYRESLQRARDLARQGILAVEMEASALWAVAHARGLRAASLFVVSDELGGDGWNPGFRDPAFLAAKKEAVRAVVDVISESSP